MQTREHLNTSPKELLVIKLGGNVISSDRSVRALADDLKFLQAAGRQIVLVHGGGNRIDEKLKEKKIPIRKVQGLRVTDAATMSVVKEVLEEVNALLVDRLSGYGLPARGFTGKSGVLVGKPVESDVLVNDQGASIDLGFVGEVADVDSAALIACLQAAKIPLIAPIGTAGNDIYFNINADDASSAVAQKLGAQQLIFLSDVPGVRPAAGTTAVLPVISADDYENLRRSGAIDGGMGPKLKTAFAAINNGVAVVQIIDGTAAGLLSSAVEKPGTTGTLIVR